MPKTELPKNLRIALEFAEDFALAHCIEEGVSGVLLYRDQKGHVYRRLIGPRGSSEIPESFDDSLVLARLAATGSEKDLLTMDAVLAEAEAAGHRVVVIPPPEKKYRNRGDV